MKSIPRPIRERILVLNEHGKETAKIASIFGVCIAAVRLDGVRAPWVFEGAMDGAMFLAWVRQGLTPTLLPGDWVIMDYLATHKVAGVRESMEEVGANLLYWPPYSPDFNPIENRWSKINP